MNLRACLPTVSLCLETNLAMNRSTEIMPGASRKMSSRVSHQYRAKKYEITFPDLVMVFGQAGVFAHMSAQNEAATIGRGRHPLAQTAPYSAAPYSPSQIKLEINYRIN